MGAGAQARCPSSRAAHRVRPGQKYCARERGLAAVGLRWNLAPVAGRAAQLPSLRPSA